MLTKEAVSVNELPGLVEATDGRVAAQAQMHRQTELSARELEVLRLSGDGKSVKQIAHELHVSHATVTTLVSRARQKLGASCKTHAVALAIRGNLL
jgi:two-component system, NarL family, response regulator DesR